MNAEGRTIPVNVPGAPYEVTVRAGSLSDVGPAIRALMRAAKAAVITDSHVGPLYADALLRSLRSAGIAAVVATIPAGEDHKTLAELHKLYDPVLAFGIDRATPVIALGGGVVGDMAGFLAATLLRGVPLVQVPTTLLAMVDASVGGKTAVNHPVGKNLIGAFHQPRAVLIDPATLRSLPTRELRGGLSECIKHEVIRDADGFARLEGEIGRALALDIDYLGELVAHNVAIKARVVEEDPFERGQRAHLNFGHTFAHAIETLSAYAYSHGEAVALGMVAAANLAADLGMISRADAGRIAALIGEAGLPTGGVKLQTDAILHEMAFDKKVSGSRLRLVLPTRIGAATVRDDVEETAIRRAIDSIRG